MCRNCDFPTMKTSHGCWTCRLRRKKCDEMKPTCRTCATLEITCHNQENIKPEWMDGGPRQASMANRIKRDIKIKSHQRRGSSVFETSSEITITPEHMSSLNVDYATHLPNNETAKPTNSTQSFTKPFESWYLPRSQRDQRDYDKKIALQTPVLQGSDAVLSLFYLEKVLPFLFPFYSPSLLQGGKGWILEMITKRPAIRRAIFCQATCFALACESAIGDANWDDVLASVNSAFCTLRESLTVINSVDIQEHLDCTIRIMTSIMQLHRFEVTILCFENWEMHLRAVLGLFKQLLDTHSSFNAILKLLGPPIILPMQNTRFPNAEQAAFYFTSTLVILDDIIASTTLQKQPKLYHHHRNLLCDSTGDADGPVNIETVLGIKNWVLLYIGEIATLDAWKLECKRMGNLDVLELAHRATAIRGSLMTRLTELENQPTSDLLSQLDMFLPSDPGPSQRTLITRVWAHAALLYLFIVTSGWQPANDSVRYHVNQILELLRCQILPPPLLRTAVWPFCVAGCLAEPAQEIQFHQMMRRLTPRKFFGKIYKAFEVIEKTWHNRHGGDNADRDLAACFRSLDDLVLLV